MIETEEEWRDIPGWEGFYQASDLGMVRSVDRIVPYSDKRFLNRRGKLMVDRFNGRGYKLIMLSRNNKPKGCSVHRLIALTFVPNPDNLPEVNHKNNIKTDNRAVNLEWCTRSENVRQSYKTGSRSNTGELHPRSKLTESQVLEIRSIKNMKRADIATMFNVSKESIDAIITRRNWKHI